MDMELMNPEPDETELGTSRGRRTGRGVRTPEHLYVASPELDVFDETSPLWAPRPQDEKCSASASTGRSPCLESQNYGLQDEREVGGGYGESILLGVEAEDKEKDKHEQKEKEKEKRKCVRPGSTPPAPSSASAWSMMKHMENVENATLSLRFSDLPPYAGEGYYHGLGLGLVAGSGQQLMAIPGRNAARSRSVGWERVGEDYRRLYE